MGISKMSKNTNEKRVYLVEFSNGNEAIMYSYSVRDLLYKLKTSEWDSFMDVTSEYDYNR